MIFVIACAAQIRANRFNPYLYWTTIIATTTLGTTLADFADRSLGIGYSGGSSLLLVLLMGSLVVWYRTMGDISVHSVNSPKVETFYWVTIMFSQTLGTALGDWTADTAGPGYTGQHGDIWHSVVPHRSGLLPDQSVPRDAVLGGLYSDPATGGRTWRFSG